MKLALTGHRNQRLSLPTDEKDARWNPIKGWMKQMIKDAIYASGDNYVEVICGMASGCDIAFGLAAKELIDSGEPVVLHCVLPCDRYNSSSPYYSELESISAQWTVMRRKFEKGCDNLRDAFMVDNCDTLLAVWDSNKSGGVWSTIQKAEKQHKRIIYIPEDIL